MKLTDKSQRLARFEWLGEVLHGRLIATGGNDALEALTPIR
ncbi:hypothetical protein [Streptomyces sp. TRM49041]|nr:hypothetical protein [Streptomyces sp. TRM49041]